jgi:DUF1365 family protein
VVTSTTQLPALPALVRGQVSHRRHSPAPRSFHHDVYQWLVDLDDHLGGRGDDDRHDLAANVRHFLALNGETVEGGKIVMLANARVLGHVFDPLSVFWCFGADGELSCIVAEVHNTYGEWHAYLLHPDPGGLAGADKELYVSPFYDVSGRYEMRFTLTADTVDVRVGLIRNGVLEFEAAMSGVPAPATPARLLRTLLRQPLMPQKVSALIRGHGAALWARRLPVVARPRHRAQEGV